MKLVNVPQIRLTIDEDSAVQTVCALLETLEKQLSKEDNAELLKDTSKAYAYLQEWYTNSPISEDLLDY